MTIDAGHRHGIWVGICGELGADTALTETFLRMGVDELSMNAKSVLAVRKIIRSVDLSKPLCQECLSSPDGTVKGAAAAPLPTKVLAKGARGSSF